MNLTLLKIETVDRTEKEFARYRVDLNKASIYKSLSPEAKEAQEIIGEYSIRAKQGRYEEVRQEAIKHSKEIFEAIPSKDQRFAYGLLDISVQAEILDWCKLTFWKSVFDKILLDPDSELKELELIHGFDFNKLAFQKEDLIGFPKTDRDRAREKMIKEYSDVLIKDGISLVTVSCSDRIDRLEKVRKYNPSKREYDILLNNCPCGYEFNSKKKLAKQIDKIFDLAESLNGKIKEIFLTDFYNHIMDRIDTYQMYELEPSFIQRWPSLSENNKSLVIEEVNEISIPSNIISQENEFEEFLNLRTTFLKGLYVRTAYNHFKALAERSNTDGIPYLRHEQLLNFLKRGFLNDKSLPKQMINLRRGEKGFVIKLFYDFFNMAVTDYGELNKKKKYVQLIVDCFDNWGYDSIFSFFKPNKTRKNW